MPAPRILLALPLLMLAACEPLPEFGALRRAGGVVERVWPGDAGGAWQVRVAGDSAAYTLPAEEVEPLAPGDSLRLWLDPETGEVWHATAGGRILVPYAERAAEVRRVNAWMGWSLAGLALFLLVGVPLGEGAAFRERLRRPLTRAEPAGLQPDEARDLGRRAAELESLGFRPEGLFAEQSGSTSVLWALFRNPRQGEAAVAASVTAGSGTHRTTRRFTAFATPFAGGVTVQTFNGAGLASLPAPPGRFAEILPGEQRLGRLLLAHRTLARIHVPGAGDGALPDDLAAWFAAEPARELEGAWRAGWLRPGRDPEEVRLSARGIAVGLPLRVEPVRALRRWMAARRTRRLLRSDPRWSAEAAAVPRFRASDAEAAAALARLAGGAVPVPPATAASTGRGGLVIAAVLAAAMLAVPLWLSARGFRQAAVPVSALRPVTGMVDSVELRAPEYVSSACAMIHLRGADGVVEVYRARMMCPDDPSGAEVAAGDRVTLWTQGPDGQRAWRMERDGRVVLHEETQRRLFRRLARASLAMAAFPLLLMLLVASPVLLRRLGITGGEEREPMPAGLNAIAWAGGGTAVLGLMYLLTPVETNAAAARSWLLWMSGVGAAAALGAVLLHRLRTRPDA